ncbi:hypothetical protein ACFVUS_20735 [Nocardia sp. NPDC058058]|uniref:hypothetical protein n=1 Tax=Nocardia sp. NPDC058058 TaxID=3346317 RepID=UPI0036D8FFB6
MSNPVPAWKPGTFSATTATGAAGTASRTFNINNLPQKETLQRVMRLSSGRQMVKDFRNTQQA